MGVESVGAAADTDGFDGDLRDGAPRPLLSRSAEARLGARQREVLEQLESVFLDRGFAAFTIADLAAGVGCSRRTLYELAPSKDELVLMVLDRYLHKKGRGALDAIDPADTSARQIRAYIEAGVAFEWQARLSADLADDAPARRLVDRHYRFVMTVVERLVTRGIEAGEFRPVNPSVVALTITGASLFIEEADVPDAFGLSSADAVAQVLDLVLPSLATT